MSEDAFLDTDQTKKMLLKTFRTFSFKEKPRPHDIYLDLDINIGLILIDLLSKEEISKKQIDLDFITGLDNMMSVWIARPDLNSNTSQTKGQLERFFLSPLGARLIFSIVNPLFFVEYDEDASFFRTLSERHIGNGIDSYLSEEDFIHYMTFLFFDKLYLSDQKRQDDWKLSGLFKDNSQEKIDNAEIIKNSPWFLMTIMHHYKVRFPALTLLFIWAFNNNFIKTGDFDNDYWKAPKEIPGLVEKDQQIDISIFMEIHKLDQDEFEKLSNDEIIQKISKEKFDIAISKRPTIKPKIQTISLIPSIPKIIESVKSQKNTPLPQSPSPLQLNSNGREQSVNSWSDALVKLDYSLLSGDGNSIQNALNLKNQFDNNNSTGKIKELNDFKEKNKLYIQQNSEVHNILKGIIVS